MMPHRVQLSRAKGWRMPPNTVKVSRPTQWGNRFRVGDDNIKTAGDAVAMFEHDAAKFECFHPKKYEQWIAPLRGKNLACWCRHAPCHADVLLALANPDSHT